MGRPSSVPPARTPDALFVYHGFYRHGRSGSSSSYRVGDVEMLDAPWAEDGRFTASWAGRPHPSAALGAWQLAPMAANRSRPRCSRGNTRPYAVDTIEVPFKNPRNALMFFGDHDFLPDGTAFLGTMTGDV